MRKLIYIFLSVSIIFTACKKEEGCMDTIATNYNPDAEVDEGPGASPELQAVQEATLLS